MALAANATASGKDNGSYATSRTTVLIGAIIFFFVFLGMLHGAKRCKRTTTASPSSSSSAAASSSSSVAPRVDIEMSDRRESKADDPGYVAPASLLDPKKIRIGPSASLRNGSYNLRAAVTTNKGKGGKKKSVWSSTYNQAYENKVREW